MIKAVLFDFDGVVAQSEPLHYETFVETLAPLGIKIPYDRWYVDFAGTGSRSIMERLFKENHIDKNVDEFVEKRKKLYETYVKKGKLKITAGLVDFLDYLSSKKIRTAVVSGGHKSNIELVLSTMKLSDRFELIVSSDDLKAKKPDPYPYLYAAEKLGLNPSECLGIEDSLAGATSVVRAGMKLVVIDSPASSKISKYDVLIKDFTSFPYKQFF